MMLGFALISLAIVASANAAGYHSDWNHDIYHGCYLNQDVTSFEFAMEMQSMNTEICQTRCQQQFNYFYVKGVSCYCGPSTWVSQYGKQDDSKCSSECYQGNAPNNCGVKVHDISMNMQQNNYQQSNQYGNQQKENYNMWQNNMWQNNNAWQNNNNNQNNNFWQSNMNNYNSQQQNSMWNNQDNKHDGMDHEGQYNGCYQSQDLESFTFGMKLQAMDHSCKYHCQQEQAGYFYEMGDSCYCGPSSWVSQYGKLEDSQCSSQCYQSNAPNCGVKVYSTSDMKQNNKLSHSGSHTDGSWNYYGCFANQELNNFQFMYQEQSMSYEKCLGSCHDKQFTFSYVQESACFCGSSEWSFEQNQNDECINGNRVYKWSTGGKNYNNNMNSFLNDFIATTVKNFMDQGVDVENSQSGNWNNMLGSFNNMF